MQHRTVTVVNERVAGERRFSIGGESPASWDSSNRNSVRARIAIWTGNESYIKAENYGRVFQSDEEWREFCVTYGYTRVYYTHPGLRLKRIFQADDGKIPYGFYNLSERECIRLIALHQQMKRWAKGKS